MGRKSLADKKQEKGTKNENDAVKTRIDISIDSKEESIEQIKQETDKLETRTQSMLLKMSCKKVCLN